jgi:hypothetical protein
LTQRPGFPWPVAYHFAQIGIIYRGTDIHIHELWFNGKWNHNDLTNASGYPDAPVGSPTGSPAAGDPAGYTWSVDKTEHVVYRGADSHIQELLL